MRIKQSREEIKQLQPIRQTITEFIEERREVLRENVDQERQLSQTLNSTLAIEVDLHLNLGQGIPQAEFNGQGIRSIGSKCHHAS